MRVVLFFTFGVSLEKWVNSGLFDREVELYRKLFEMGVETVFITYGDEQDLMFSQRVPYIKILPLYARCGRPKSKLMRLIHSFRLPFICGDVIKDADILKTNQMYGAWVAVFSRYLFNSKVILRCGYEWYRNIFVRARLKDKRFVLLCPFAYLLSFFSYQGADRIIISNRSDYDFIKKRFFVPSERILTLGNYVDVERFMWLDDGHMERILFIGRISAQKNIVTLCRAIRGTGIGLDIVGDGDLKGEVNNLVRQESLDVRLLGVFPNSELPKIINNYRIFVLPSLYENSPKALLEAMACGRAVIGTNVEGIREIITDKVNGLLCETTEESIRSAIEFLRDNKELSLRLGAEAREYIVDNFSLAKVVTAEFKLYKEMALSGKT